MNKMICAVLCVIALTSAQAATDYIYYHANSSSDSDSAIVDLNNYSASHVDSIDLYGHGYGASQSDDDIEFAWAEASLGGYYAQDSSSGPTCNAYAWVGATNINKDGNGDWIAEIVSTPNGLLYNQNLGSGILNAASSGSGTGYGSGMVWLIINY